MKGIYRGLLILMLLCSPIFAKAAPVWEINKESSKLTFSAVQNNSPISGEFKTFSGDINFDPADLKTSHVKIVVATDSVSTAYKEVQDTLRTADWFNIKMFPEAVFKADHFIKTGNNTFQADGTLTLRDKTFPVQLTFVLDEYSTTTAKATGNAIIKRTLFGVGQGEWSKTDGVKDDVKVI